MIACVLLIIQGISEIIKRAAMLAGTIPDSNARARHMPRNSRPSGW